MEIVYHDDHSTLVFFKFPDEIQEFSIGCVILDKNDMSYKHFPAKHNGSNGIKIDHESARGFNLLDGILLSSVQNRIEFHFSNLDSDMENELNKLNIPIQKVTDEKGPHFVALIPNDIDSIKQAVFIIDKMEI